MLPLLNLLLSPPAEACGPWFDHPHLASVGSSMLDAPRSSFEDDLRAQTNRGMPPAWLQPKRVRTEEGDRSDLLEVTGDAALTEAFLSARAELQPAPEGVPEEFRLYQAAVIELRAERLEAAEALFEELLALPPEQRRWRSTWAMYMLPHTHPEDTERGLAEYAQVRELASEGYEDSLGLALASLHQEAVHAPAAQALDACLTYREAGGRVFCSDLEWRTARVLEAEDLGPALERPRVVAAVAALLTSHQHVGGGALRWLEAAEAHAATLPAADRLAWAAYQRGEFELAERWARRAGGQPMAHWMLGKLALREGDLELAAEQLQEASRLFPSPQAELFAQGFPEGASCAHHDHHPVRALHVELGILLVALERPQEATRAFLQAGDWMDAAWVAENLLSTEELVEFVERWFPPPVHEPWEERHVQGLLDGTDLPASQVPASMRHLLARRLAREGRIDQALRYFPGTVRWDAYELHELLQEAEDPSLSEDQRGTAMWQAAFLMKQEGWELLATEMEPDFRVLEGWYEGPDTRGLRLRTEDALLAPTAAEQARLQRHGAPNDNRYHFVWTAHELAWEAVQLMDDDNPELPQALCTGGAWQRTRDPASADRFLKQLNQRVPGQTLALGWLPSLGEDGLCPDQQVETASAGCSTSPRAPLQALLVLVLLVLGARATLARHRPDPHAAAPRSEL